jgi:hypothetical protein
MIGASAECVTPTTSCGQIVLLAHLNHNFLQHKIVPHVFSATVTYQSIYCRFHQLIERVRNLPRLGIPCLNQTFNININLLYIGSDNLPFLGAYLQNGCIAVTHHSAIVYNALSNPKVRIISMHLMHPLILESHQIQSPRPFE